MSSVRSETARLSLVFSASFLQPLHLIEFQAAILIAPAMDCGLGHTDRLGSRRDGLSLSGEDSTWRSLATISSGLRRFFGMKTSGLIQTHVGVVSSQRQANRIRLQPNSPEFFLEQKGPPSAGQKSEEAFRYFASQFY